MGQRLNIEIFNNGELLANGYYHWSGFTTSSMELTKVILDNYDKIMALDLCIKTKAILLLQLTNAGLMVNDRDDELQFAIENLPRQDLGKIELKPSINRNEGLISITEDNMEETRQWEEARITIYLDTKKIDFDNVYIDSKESWQEDYPETNYDDLPLFPFETTWDIDFKDFRELYDYFKMAYEERSWYFRYTDNQVLTMIE
jgi:hypothetical protein